VTVRVEALEHHSGHLARRRPRHPGRNMWSMKKLVMFGALAALVAVAVRKVRSI
jgi:hypothetical protein